MRPKMCTWEGQTRPGGTGRDCAFQHSCVCWQAHSFGQAGQAATKWTNSPQNRQTPELNLLRLSARWSQVLPSCIDSSLEGRAGHDVAETGWTGLDGICWGEEGQRDEVKGWAGCFHRRSLRCLSSLIAVATRAFRSRGRDMRASASQTGQLNSTKCFLQGWLVSTSIDHKGPEIHLILHHQAGSLVDHGQSFGGDTGMIWVPENCLEVVLKVKAPRSVWELIDWAHVSPLPLSSPIKKFTQAESVAKEREHCSNPNRHWRRNPLHFSRSPSNGSGSQCWSAIYTPVLACRLLITAAAAGNRAAAVSLETNCVSSDTVRIIATELTSTVSAAGHVAQAASRAPCLAS